MEKTLKDMNEALASCMTLVIPPIEYPPQMRPNPVQHDSTDMADLNEHMAHFFFQAKKLELQLLALDEPGRPTTAHELEAEIQSLEAELSDKNDLIDKYSDVIRGWEGKFKRLDSKMNAS
ncbi:hypothetical protein SDRG_04566 [Saprolegnia diclina VS20]|uniref:Mediator of RNA polymerase II transcription subunit 28 n=1 Tax=Saprolegnia diclina (strain VS20) TaxID=1156394 RepID=T0QTU8_SAPDV|nr:hypothetical protein SDRG_04566 [Saprolegnia diclina VS20]EQC38136.1 hypothetical protein SDRG_04566 [Saprolegnia diclina VS20]|eukprot:XP_008608463.1 hypothetical protein SDRG_04566 [Saprolegnia diclina VS20]